MSLFDDLSRDHVGGMPANILSEKRNFQQPKETFFGTTVPMDVSLADDSGLISQIQKYLKGGPLGISYSGPIDGNINSILLQSISNFELALEKKFPDQKFIGTIRFGTFVSSSGWNKAIKLLSTKPTEKNDSNNNQSDEIIKFQKFLGLAPSGKADQIFINAIKNLENKISSDISDPAVGGMIWNDTEKKINTSLDDVQQALKIISDFKKSK